MARNIEIKARLDGMGALTARVASIADEGTSPIDISQDETFFVYAVWHQAVNAGAGRLGRFAGATTRLT